MKNSYLFRNKKTGISVIITHNNHSSWLYDLSTNKVKRLPHSKVLASEDSITILTKSERFTFKKSLEAEIIPLWSAGDEPYISSFQEKDIEKAFLNGALDIKDYIPERLINGIELIGSQIKIGEWNDIIDLLYKNQQWDFIIVELKKWWVLSKDIDQVLRYTTIMQNMNNANVFPFIFCADFQENEYNYAQEHSVKLVKI